MMTDADRLRRASDEYRAGVPVEQIVAYHHVTEAEIRAHDQGTNGSPVPQDMVTSAQPESSAADDEKGGPQLDPYAYVPPSNESVEAEGELDQRGESWRPVDLGPILRGEHVRPEPTIGMARVDGVRMIYTGKEHAVIGETESGKSWYCVACCAAELLAGNNVVYIHFEEADADGTVERLLLLEVPPDVILAQFHFVCPSERVAAAWLADLLMPAPSLVVLDGVNEGMALHDWDIYKPEGATAWRRWFVRPCNDVGAATLAADHVVKDRDARGRTAFGTVHKGNAMSGACVLLENVEPFGRGKRGRSHVFVTKDRPGALRRHGRDSATPGRRSSVS